MSETLPRDWQRLARLVIHRRVELGHARQTAFANVSGIKIRTLNSIENARATGYDLATIAKLERALNWEAGSVDSVLGGGDPKPTKPETKGPPSLAELERARRILIDALRLDDPEAMREKLADALALVGQAMEHERRDAAG